MHSQPLDVLHCTVQYSTPLTSELLRVFHPDYFMSASCSKLPTRFTGLARRGVEWKRFREWGWRGGLEDWRRVQFLLERKARGLDEKCRSQGRRNQYRWEEIGRREARARLTPSKREKNQCRAGSGILIFILCLTIAAENAIYLFRSVLGYPTIGMENRPEWPALLFLDPNLNRSTHEVMNQPPDQFSPVSMSKYCIGRLNTMSSGSGLSESHNSGLDKAAATVNRMDLEQKDCSVRVDKLLEKNGWIAAEKQLFEQNGTDYDFSSRDLSKSRQEFEKLQSEQSRTVNFI
ncbi:Structural maintenance of chromosomes protein 2-1 [Platanthera guangdongensis]|uniref:Structural maintenance of chromosomes protein 2-1 n=1 Tax=Platanthera guangdongensis TaxID=2320717 RepID=A0ABR2MNV1_9ASPA